MRLQQHQRGEQAVQIFTVRISSLLFSFFSIYDMQVSYMPL